MIAHDQITAPNGVRPRPCLTRAYKAVGGGEGGGVKRIAGRNAAQLHCTLLLLL